MAKISGRRDVKGGTPLAHTWSDGTDQSQMEKHCQWPMLCTNVKRQKVKNHNVGSDFLKFFSLYTYNLRRPCWRQWTYWWTNSARGRSLGRRSWRHIQGWTKVYCPWTPDPRPFLQKRMKEILTSIFTDVSVLHQMVTSNWHSIQKCTKCKKLQ